MYNLKDKNHKLIMSSQKSVTLLQRATRKYGQASVAIVSKLDDGGANLCLMWLDDEDGKPAKVKYGTDIMTWASHRLSMEYIGRSAKRGGVFWDVEII